ncbi:hypothetical protein ACIBCM_31520 [Streptomyces sp. NPDC051018]|uniref:hypothetical protein n=1 Tax=Streptomyces sp. NPDC051018 TaxID=3365639 RepID=UPI0037AC3BE4
MRNRLRALVGTSATALLGTLLMAAPAGAADSAPAPAAPKAALNCTPTYEWHNWDTNGTGTINNANTPIRHDPTSSCTAHDHLGAGHNFSIDCSETNAVGNLWYHITYTKSGITRYGWVYSGNVTVSGHSRPSEDCDQF